MKTRIDEPKKLSELTFSDYKKLLLFDLDKLQDEKGPVPFFLLAKYEHPKSDKQEEQEKPGTRKALLVVSDFTTDWMVLVRDNLSKRRQRDLFFGDCRFGENKFHLIFKIKKKTGSLKEAEKALSKLFQNTKYTFSFNDESTEGDEYLKNVILIENNNVNEYETYEELLKAINSLKDPNIEQEPKSKLFFMKKVIRMATKWYDENPNPGLDTPKAAKERPGINKLVDSLAEHFFVTQEKEKQRLALRRKKLLEEVRHLNETKGFANLDPETYLELMKADLPMEELFKVAQHWELGPLEIIEEEDPEIIEADSEDEIIFDEYYQNLFNEDETDFLSPLKEPGLDKYITVPVNVIFTTEELRGYYKFRSKGVVKVTETQNNNGTTFHKFKDRGKDYSINNELTLGEAYWKVVDEPIFPEEPHPSHVKQGHLGDCYLLAALASLARKDPQFIKEMIVDMGTFAVVRLFLVEENENGTPKYTPKYYHVKKTVVKNSSGEDLFAKECLWVSLIEKAWALGKFRGTKQNTFTQQHNDEFTNNIENIASGESDFAFEVLTGMPAESWSYYDNNTSSYFKNHTHISIKINAAKTFNTKHLTESPWSEKETDAFDNEEYEKMVSYQILGKNRKLLQKWGHYISFPSPIGSLFEREYDDGLGELTIEDFENLFNGTLFNKDGSKTSCKKLDGKVAKIILEWMRKNAIFPESRDKGAYSSLQIAMFKKIKSDLKDGKMVTIGTKSKFAEKPNAEGVNATESVVKGISSSHGYSVFDFKEEENGLCYLHVRNPWGKVVQRKVKARDWFKELEGSIDDVMQKLRLVQKRLGQLAQNQLTKELQKLVNSKTVPIEKLKTAITSVGNALQNETESQTPDLQKIDYLKSLFNILDEIALLVSQKLKFETAKSNIGVMSYISNEWLIVESESDPNLPSGEFWLPLHQLSRYFSTIFSSSK